MSRYIDADALMEKLPKEYLGSTVHAMINEAPSIDIEPKQGEWIYTNDPLRLDDEWACSRCGNISFARTNFCDRCGAKMKGADDEAISR